MIIIDDYKRHRDRYTRLLKRGLVSGSGYEFCPLCGRPRDLEFHHYARSKHYNRALPACQACHNVFRDCEQFEHRLLCLDLGDYRERQLRQMLGFVDILEFIAAELRLITQSSTFELGTKIVRDSDCET